MCKASTLGLLQLTVVYQEFLKRSLVVTSRENMCCHDKQLVMGLMSYL